MKEKPRHKTFVIINSTGPHPDQYQAWCICGWESQAHTAHSHAAGAAAQHHAEQ